jgi:hypothetical protein
MLPVVSSQIPGKNTQCTSSNALFFVIQTATNFMHLHAKLPQSQPLPKSIIGPIMGIGPIIGMPHII